MIVQYTSNNVPFEVNHRLRLVCLMPITDVHKENIVYDALNEISSKYITYEVGIDWQNK